MERQSDNNPWALRLQEVTLPDAEDGWKAMAGVLDKEMPAERKKRRRWLLLIVLLPLAAVSGYLVWRTRGVPSRVGSPRGESSATPGTSPEKSSEAKPRVSPGSSSPKINSESSPAPSSAISTETIPGNPGTSPLPETRTLTRQKPRPSRNGGRSSLDAPLRPKSESNRPGGEPRQASGESRRSGAENEPHPSDREIRHSDPGNIVPFSIARPNLRVPKIVHSGDPLKCPPVEKEKTSGWVLGIGLNQSIPVDGQQVWTNASGGLNTWWKDYIPVPFARYYFQPKVFLQAEARFHAPQYTPKGIWFWYRYNDSLYSGLLLIKKLFYFQLPVTIHYAPSPDWSVGLGLQYFHYGSGIVAQTDSGVYNNFYSFIGPLSGFPMVFVQHNEFRGLISVDYTYRHWIIGMSYDAAFNKTLTVRVPDPAATPQALILQSPPPFRNSSLQLFVRYILWDGRKQR